MKCARLPADEFYCFEENCFASAPVSVKDGDRRSRGDGPEARILDRQCAAARFWLWPSKVISALLQQSAWTHRSSLRELRVMSLDPLLHEFKK
jgi:hypothetical protein